MSSRAESAALLRAARFGLCEDAAPVDLGIEEAASAIRLARFDHITGLLASAVLAESVRMPQAARESVLANWREELRLCVVLEALLVRVVEILGAADVDFRLTKGPALAHLDFEDPSVRTFGDIDIIVHPTHWEAAKDALLAAGFGQRPGSLSSEYERRFGKGVTLVSPEELELDVHRRLAIGRFGVTSDTSELFHTSDHIELAGIQIPALGPSERLVHACYHASLGGFRRLRAFRDVAQLLLRSNADLEQALELAQGWKAQAVIAAAVTETWQRLDLDHDSPFFLRVAEIPVSRADQRALRTFAEHQRYRRQVLTAVPRLGPLESARLVWMLGANRLRAKGPRSA